MSDNYNYYTSTHHSTPLRTYYIALNRLGGPRKTHLPANKPLGKLSIYVKSFTLTVPEQRSDAIIARLFGINHVKHGMKHLCDSGKELMPLTAPHLIIPKNCTTIVSIASKAKSKAKHHQHPQHHHHHHNQGNGSAPAALTQQHPKRQGAKQNNCTHGNCAQHKKKVLKNESDRNDNDKANASTAFDSQEANKFKQKQKKNQKKNNNNNRNKNSGRAETTTTTTPTTVRTTTNKTPIYLNSIMARGGQVDDDNVRQILDDGPSAFADDDDDYDYQS